MRKASRGKRGRGKHNTNEHDTGTCIQCSSAHCCSSSALHTVVVVVHCTLHKPSRTWDDYISAKLAQPTIANESTTTVFLHTTRQCTLSPTLCGWLLLSFPQHLLHCRDEFTHRLDLRLPSCYERALSEWEWEYANNQWNSNRMHSRFNPAVRSMQTANMQAMKRGMGTGMHEPSASKASWP